MADNFDCVLGVIFAHNARIETLRLEVFGSEYHEWEQHPDVLNYTDIWRARYKGPTLEVGEPAAQTNRFPKS